MSTSLIEYKTNYIDVNDTILILSMHYFKVNNTSDAPIWFNNYIENVVDNIILVKPVGWACLELDDYLINEERRTFFVDRIYSVIDKLNGNRIINATEFNEILRMEETEGYSIQKSVLKTQTVIDFFVEVIKLLK